MRPFGPLPPTFATSTPSSRAKRRTEGLAWEAVPDRRSAAVGIDTRCGAAINSASPGRESNAAPPPAATAAAGAAATGAAAEAAAVGAAAAGAAGLAAASAPTLTRASTTPSATLSPTLTFNSVTTPDTGEGMSMVALSDSSVINESSAFTVSPTLTSSSMIGTSLKSPMSGTLTSTTAAGAAAAGAEAAGAAAGAAAAGAATAACPATALSIRATRLPSATLSPIFSLISVTTPETGDGTSMVALSDSSVTSESSALTTSPTLTSSSITGTSLKSPISGTFTSTMLLMAYTFTGLGLFGSRPYFLIASATFSFFNWPSSTSADSAASVIQ